ncbi:BTAD domain-containing putative transcriptional regulator [Plantactinospora siamensis]|uniref:BTAD domain-containing putative transcriptional regulator n=1 Tax=Plantactinospora siamensis TaxID=555372 RepID=A0ABV6NWK4_9ACTN
MAGEVRFEVLGPQRAWTGDRELDLGPGKQRAVLGVLLLRPGRPVPTTQILEAVWQEDLPANGPNVVQKYVAGLRRILEPERSPRAPGQLIGLTEAGYVLRAGRNAVDLCRFEDLVRQARVARSKGESAVAAAALRSGLDLWHGEPLGGLPGPYFAAARARLAEDRAAAVELWAELELSLGRHRDVATELVPLVAEMPLREGLRHALMLAQYRSGRQAEALAAYREIRTLLAEEHGLEPGKELRELHRRILRADPGLAGPPGISRTPVGPAAGPAVEPVSMPPPNPAALAFPPPPSMPSAGSPAWYGAPPPLPGTPPWPGGPTSGRRGASRGWLALATIAGTVVALGSLGMLTWAVVLGYALFRRSRRLAAAGIGYGLLAATFVAVAVNKDSEDFTRLDLLGVPALLVSWFVGAGHVVLLNRHVQAMVARLAGRAVPDNRRTAGVDPHRLRREQARYLLYHHPASRHELHIGRPDLPRGYDDGGLVDVNSVTEDVLRQLPGLSAEQGQQISMDRWLRGPYATMEDLAGRCLLPPAVTDGLREILVFLPPGPTPVPIPPPTSMPQPSPGSVPRPASGPHAVPDPSD